MATIDNFRAYVISDPLYYDRIDRAPQAEDYLSRLHERVGSLAAVDIMGIWVRCLHTPVHELPEHGWKLHISARPTQLAAMLDDVIDEFLIEPFSFKCVRTAELATAQLSRWWPRGGAGKAFAIYPTSLEHAHDLAERLTKRLSDYAGAHILSDRRFPGSQVVQYRYGTFRKPATVDPDGRASSVVIGPDGTAWSDDRSPKFTLPPWLTEDPFDSDGNRSVPPSEFLRRYRVRGSLHSSTAGGVYLATTADGTEVVLKECRPDTAFSPDGSDAVSRLHREKANLELLSGTGVVPEAIELAQVWEHTFLAQTRIPGVTLQVWISRNHPFVQGFTDQASVSAYRAKVADLIAQLRAVLTTCLERGIVYGDVSLTNILVDDDGTLRLVDLEGGRARGLDPADHPRTTGFAPSPGSPSWQTDQGFLDFAVAAVEAACVSARNSLLALEPRTFARSLRHTAGQLDWPVDALLGRLADGAPAVAGTEAEAEPSWAEVLGGIADHLGAAATPNRRDRLFPAQPELFATNPLSLAHGAAGVLRDLNLIGGTVDPEHLRWLCDWLETGPNLPPGLFYGRAGIGMCLLELGEVDRGTEQLRSALADVEAGYDRPDVASGLAGIGLALLAAGTGDLDSSWLTRALRIGELLAGSAEDDGTGLWWPTTRPGRRALGYGYGSAGIAVFLSELAYRTGEERFTALARRALQHDLNRGRIRDNGALGFGAYDGSRAFEPYVIRGGAGIGMAATQLARRRPEPGLTAAVRAMVRGIGQPFSVNPGQFSGMAGIAEFLLDARALLDEPADLSIIDDYLSQLVGEILAMRYVGPGRGELAFPGDGLLRLSCDHAAGSAGIALLFKRMQDGGDTLDVRYGGRYR